MKRAVESRRRPRPAPLHTERLERRLTPAAVGWDDWAGGPTSPATVLQPPSPPPFQAAVSLPHVARRTAAPAPIVHEIASEFQRGPTRLRVLLPATYTPAKTYRTVYVLPVEAGNGTQYGDGLRVIEQARFHDVYDTIFVAPAFSDTPWYGDHPTNTNLRQERHLLDTVIPFVESRYAVSRQAADRLLLGFSRSGYGAFSLLLRHPDRFGKAAAWDAPLGLTAPRSEWGMPQVFGSTANFNAYRVTRLITQRAPELAGGPARLILAGSNVFRSDHARVAQQLRDRGVPHVFVSGPRYAHAWGGGWLPGAVRQLVG